jgi:hypothetical protein
LEESIHFGNLLVGDQHELSLEGCGSVERREILDGAAEEVIGLDEVTRLKGSSD